MRVLIEYDISGGITVDADSVEDAERRFQAGEFDEDIWADARNRDVDCIYTEMREEW